MTAGLNVPEAFPMNNLNPFDKTELVASIRPGDRVTILVPAGFGRNGQEYKARTGVARICSGTHAALNMGGRYGTPGVATPDNIVSVRKAKSQTNGEKA